MAISYVAAPGYKFVAVHKVTLTASVESTITVNKDNFCIIQNCGVGSCYVAFDETANSTKWTLLDGDVFPVPVKCSAIHFLSSSTPTVQVIELCLGY